MPAVELGFKNVEIFPAHVIRRVGLKHLTLFVKRVFTDGKDKDGRTFRAYTKKYAELKAEGFQKLKTTRKGKTRTGTKYIKFKEMGLSRQINPPNLALTYQTRNATRMRGVGKNNYRIGWAGEAADIVGYQKEQKRNIIDDIPDDEREKVAALLVKELNIELKKKIKPYTKVVV